MSVERELAVHDTEIKHLQADMDKMVNDMDEIKSTLKSIQQTLDQAHGGWRMLMAVASVAGTIGAIVGWFFDHWSK